MILNTMLTYKLRKSRESVKMDFLMGNGKHFIKMEKPKKRSVMTEIKKIRSGSLTTMMVGVKIILTINKIR